jgi:hypothetical protein
MMLIPTLEWTPGPWRLAADFAQSGIIESKTADIAIVTGYDATGHETEANDRLIAAAPDMIDFLIEFFTVANRMGMARRLTGGMECVWVQIPTELFVKGQTLLKVQRAKDD